MNQSPSEAVGLLLVEGDTDGPGAEGQGAHAGDRLPMALGMGLGTGTSAALLVPVWRSIDPSSHHWRGEKNQSLLRGENICLKNRTIQKYSRLEAPLQF